MRSKTIFGALLVSVALCSQAFSFELLDRMLGLNGGGCGECNACAKVTPCQPACQPTCAKACEKACLPTVPATCKEKVCRPTPVRDLFANIKDLFEAKACQTDPVCCEAPKCCPEPACCPKTVRCHKIRCAAKACCEKACKVCEPACKAACAPACEPVCEKPCKPKTHKLYRRPVLEMLENLFGCNECGCGEAGCEAGCGGTAPVKGVAPTTGPAKAPETTTPPPPVVPKPDPQTSNQPRGIFQASRSLARN
jgi:hypothetical protein